MVLSSTCAASMDVNVVVQKASVTGCASSWSNRGVKAVDINRQVIADVFGYTFQNRLHTQFAYLSH